jgi:hypothetical protein
VRALATQVRSLVESARVLGLARALDPRDHVEESSLRRRAAGREIETRRLTRRQPPEAEHADRHAHGEVASSRRAGHLEARRRRTPDLAGQDAAVERLEAHASPPAAGRRESQGQRRRAVRPEVKGEQRERCRGERERRARAAHGKRGRKPDAGRAEE